MQIIHDRRALHALPEQGSCLPKTMAYLQASLGSRAFSPMPGALAAFFDFHAEQTLAFRADCDALPIGHCCGHDGHMAILLEFARWLEGRTQLDCNILLLFQPAEETTGGAKALCSTGILEQYGVSAIFGLHIWPGLPNGTVFTRPGSLMAGSRQIDAEFLGKAAHIALPGTDAVAAAAEFVSKTWWEGPEGLLKYGLLQAGCVGNVTAEQAKLQGSLRCLRERDLQEQSDFLRRTAEKCAKAYRCQVRLTLSDGYSPVTNAPELVKKVRQIFPLQLLSSPVWQSEDFSEYQKQIPGVFFLLGAGDGPALHSKDFSFPEEILSDGATLWQTIAKKIHL